MALPSNYNRVRFTTATTGTGAITVGAAVTGGFYTPATAGIVTGTAASYVIEDANGNFEWGVGTYTDAGTSFDRTTVLGGSSGTTPISLSGSSQVAFTILNQDVGLTFVSQQTLASDSAFIEFAPLPTDANELLFELDNIALSSGTVDFSIQVGQSGSIIATANYTYGLQIGAAANAGGQSTTSTSVTDGSGSACTLLAGTVKVRSLKNASAYKSINYDYIRNAGGTIYTIRGGGYYNGNQNAIDRVRFLFIGANMNAGANIRMYKQVG